MKASYTHRYLVRAEMVKYGNPLDRRVNAGFLVSMDSLDYYL